MSHKNDLPFIAKLNGKEKFSLRKLSVGLVTVALGTTFFLESSNSVKAAEQTNVTTNQNTSSKDTDFDTNKLRTLNIQQNKTETDIKQNTDVSEKNSNQEDNVLDNKLEKTQKNSDQISSTASKEKIQASTAQNSVVNITGAKTNESLMAGVTQGSINIHINNYENNPLIINHNDKVNVSIEDSNNLLSFNTNPSTSNNFDINKSTTSTNKNFIFTYTGNDNGVLSGFDSTFPFIAKKDIPENYYDKTINLPVTVTLPNKNSFTQNLPIKIKPYSDLVVSKEILHGFIMGPRLIGTPGKDGYPGTNGFYVENGATYYGPEPSAAADVPTDKQRDARLMQYGLEWNYGSANDPSLNPLMNVLAHIKFNKGQKILPATIKVFRIPATIKVVAPDGQRISINDYYNQLATLPEDTNFEKFLRDAISSDNTEISINQQGNFTVNGEDYSKNGAYFIQLDTLLNHNAINNWASQPDSGVGPSITTPIVNERDWKPTGTGDTSNTPTQTYTDFKFDPTVDRFVRIHFIDENTDKEIPDTLRSIITKTNSSIANPTQSIIEKLKSEGYVLDEKATNGLNSEHTENLKTYNVNTQNFRLDSLGNTYNSDKLNIKNTSPQYYVYLYHNLKEINQAVSVEEKINYVYGNGTQVGNSAAPAYSKTVTYTRTNTTDLVIKHSTWSDWKADNTLEAVNSPKANDKNYTSVDCPTIQAINLNIDIDGNITTKNNVPLTYTVHYYAPEHAYLTFYDDTDKKDLTSYLNQNNQQSLLESTYNELNNNSTKHPISFKDADDVVKFLKNKNYLFNGVTGADSINSSNYSKISYGNFDNDETKDQNFVLHFKHNTKPISDSRTVNETIHYIYEDGTKAANDAKSSVPFKETGSKDLVTDQETSSWSKPQTFAKVVSPVILGYTPDRVQINEITVDHNSKDIEETVIYKADKQKATLRFYDDTDKKFIDFAKDLNVDGSSNSAISFKIPDNYDFSNYSFIAVDVGNDPQNTSNKLAGDKLKDVVYGNFDTDSQVDQYFIAHFTHKKNAVNENKSISEKAILYAENGPKKGQNFKTIDLGNVIFSRNGQKDLVTNDITWNDWTIKNNGRNATLPKAFLNVYTINTQNITQNTPSIKTFNIKNTTISPLIFNIGEDQALITSLTNNAEFIVKVPYALSENIKVTYIDDTINKILETKDLSGKPNTDSQYSTKDTINKYLDMHYELVSDPTDQKSIFFDNDEDPNNQAYDIHFKHDIKKINNSKNVTETIVYVYDNGKEAAPIYTSSVKFNQTGESDLVTKNEKMNPWSPTAHNFEAVVSPTINGYVADHKQIAQQSVIPNSNDLLFKVTYTAKPTEPIEPDKPAQPTKPAESAKLVQPIKPTVRVKPVQSTKFNEPVKQATLKETKSNKVIAYSKSITANKAVKKDTTKHVLPQTGSKQDEISLIGLALSATSFLLGLAVDEIKRRKKN